MDTSAILLLIAVMVIVVLFVARPFLEHWNIKAGVGDKATLGVQHERVLSALQELDFDRELDKISDEEYLLQRTDLLHQGAEVLRQMDTLSIDHSETDGIPDNEGGEDRSSERSRHPISEEELEALIAKHRSSRKEKSNRICSACGRTLHKSDRFCPACGCILK